MIFQTYSNPRIKNETLPHLYKNAYLQKQITLSVCNHVRFGFAQLLRKKVENEDAVNVYYFHHKLYIKFEYRV